MVISSDPQKTIQHPNSRSALLLSGGGARAAYQVGVLKAIAEITPQGTPFPFPIICGTSAGSINTVALASHASDFKMSVNRIIDVWANFKLSDVFLSDGKNLLLQILNWAWINIGFGNNDGCPSSLLDNKPLRSLLDNTIDFDNIESSIKSGELHAYCVTACSYTSGESTTFFAGHTEIQDWQRTHRAGKRSDITLDHLMASAAIPVVFPSVKLGDEYFGDGSMRQMSPVSPALHLGADKVLIIGLRYEGKEIPASEAKDYPSLGQMSGYVMDTLFLNSLNSDIERMERINRILQNKLKESDEQLRQIKHLVISPSSDIADIAQQYYMDLPKPFRVALKLLGMTKGNSRRFMSYLMFTKRFTNALIDLGYYDGMQRREELEAYLEL